MKTHLRIVLWVLVISGLVWASELEFMFEKTDSGIAIPSAVIAADEDAFNCNRKGLAALDKGDLAGARALFEEALVKVPGYADAENNIGVIYYRQGNVALAQQLWQKVASYQPRYAIAQYNLGIVYYDEKEYASAVPFFLKAIENGKNLIEAYVMLARIKLSTNKNSEALDLFRKAFSIDQKNPIGWGSLANGLLQTRDTVGAVAILAKHTDHVEALKMLAAIEWRRANKAQAIVLLEKCVTIAKEPKLRATLASWQLENGNCKQAINQIDVYLEKEKNPVADAFLIGGLAAKECGNIAGALGYFQKGLQRFSDDSELRYNVGQVLYAQKKYDQAEQTWKTLADTAIDGNLLYLRALNSWRKGMAAQAEAILKKALDIDERGQYYDLLGVIAYSRSDKTAALDYFKKALAVDPLLQSAQLHRALMSQNIQDLKPAIVQAEAQLAQCSDTCSDIAVQLSILYYTQKNLVKACEVLLKLPEASKNERVCRHLALYFREQSEPQKAITILERARSRLVLDPPAEYELAQDYLDAGQFSQAVELLRQLVPKWDGNGWRLYYHLGYASVRLGLTEQAIDYLNKSLSLKRNNAGSQSLLAYIYNQKGDMVQARALWEKSAQTDSLNPVLFANLGLSMEQNGKFTDALAYYKRVKELTPGDNAVLLNIGNAFIGLNNTIEAFKNYETALTSPKYRELAAYNIFILAQKLNNKEKATPMAALLKKEFTQSIYTRRVDAEMSFWNGDTSHALIQFNALPEKDAYDYLSLTRIYIGKKNSQKVNEYLELLPQDSVWKKVRVNCLAQLAFSQGNFELALSRWQSIADTSFTVRYNMALAAFESKNYELAQSIGEAIIDRATGKDRTDLLRVVGNASFGLKNWNKARIWYKQLAAVEPGNATVSFNLAVAAFHLGEREVAWNYYQEARQKDPKLVNKALEEWHNGPAGSAAAAGDSVEQWYNQAVTLQGQDSAAIVSAENLYKKIISRDTSFFYAYNNLGAIYAARGDLDTALVYYQKAIVRRHDIPEAYANIIRVYLALEQFEPAKRWLIKGLGHNPDSDVLKEMERVVGDSLMSLNKNSSTNVKKKIKSGK